jgi:hypothetical protein
MKDSDNKASFGKSAVPQRAVYTAPMLRSFGAVGALTQAGSGMVAEGMMAMNVRMQRA